MTVQVEGLIAVIVTLVGVIAYLMVTRRPNRRVNLSGAPVEPHACSDVSMRDEVTGLYNKQHLLRRLEEYMARADRDNRVMALVLWDIDGFIQFNNEFGQKEGNRLLSKVGASVKKAVRVYDEVFRSGPDEFCAILLPGDMEVARQVTDRVRLSVSNELFIGESEYAGKQFSLSSGYVFYPGECRTADALLHSVNQALYRSRLTKATNGTVAEGHE